MALTSGRSPTSRGLNTVQTFLRLLIFLFALAVSFVLTIVLAGALLENRATVPFSLPNQTAH